MPGAAPGAVVIDCVGQLRIRLIGEDGNGLLSIFLGNLDTDSANGVGVKPLKLHEILILNECTNTTGLQSHSQKMGFFRLRKRGNRNHVNREHSYAKSAQIANNQSTSLFFQEAIYNARKLFTTISTKIFPGNLLQDVY